MFLTHKKNSLPDLAHGFGDTPSKLGTNRQNAGLFLGSTSVFCVFAKSGGGWAKNNIFCISQYLYSARFRNKFKYYLTVRAHRAPEQKVFWMYFQNLGENPYVIDHFCKMSSCDASTMSTPPPQISKNI